MKKPAASRRARLPRRFDYARQFLKDWPERRDHALKGASADYRECHAGGDFLLIYRIDDADGPSGSVYFSRAGTHADLFE